MLGDSFLHLPYAVIMGLLAAAIICMLFGIRAARRQKRGEPVVPLDRRHKHFAILFASLVLGFVGGYFLIRHDHPDFSVTLCVSICLSGLVLATALVAWQIYRPRNNKT